MEAEILLERDQESPGPEDEQTPLKGLEEKVIDLLREFQNLRKERDHLALALGAERERSVRFQKELEVLSREREKIKTRIDQLLHRLKGIEG